MRNETFLDFAELDASCVARWAIEIAIAGDHSICFTPTPGHAGQWTTYDLERISPQSRQLAEWWAASIEGEPFGIEAAKKMVGRCYTAMHFLATDAGGYDKAAILHGGEIRLGYGQAINVEVKPLSLVDLILPAPQEPSAPVIARIERARSRRGAIGGLDGGAQALLRGWQRHCSPDAETVAFIVEVARTIQASDTSGAIEIGQMALAGAISFSSTLEARRDNPTEGLDTPTGEIAEICPQERAGRTKRRSRKAATVAANATALLRAARRSNGAYIWGPGLCLTVPRRHHLGWLAFTWHDGQKQCTVDLDRHRSIAKAEARRIIEAQAGAAIAA